jgi:uncharacterized protein YcbK (DUF882 family)
MRRLSLALLVAVLFQGPAVAQEEAAEESGESSEAETPSPQELPPPAAPAPAEPEAPSRVTKKRPVAKKAAKPKTGKEPLRYVRKKRNGARLMGAVVPEERLRTTPVPRPSGNLHLYFLATRESLKVNIYNEDGSYNIEALKGVSHLLRCKRTQAEKEIEPRLLTILSTIYDHYGEKRLEVVSGFRNQRKTTSYHFKGSAIDIRIDGVKPPKLRDYADSLDAGGMGVGLYPRTGFVHVDVRPLPSYRWIDYARSDPDNPDKRPPRGWKRKKFQS